MWVKKDHNLQIYVTEETWLKWQNYYNMYKRKYKYKTREEFLLLLLNQFANRNSLSMVV